MKTACMHGAPLGYKNPTGAGQWVPHFYPTVYLSYR